MNRYALKARYVFPVSRPPIPEGVVTIDQGRVAAVGTSAVGAPLHDLGNVALLPGLVNAHTHLEFSDLPEPLGAPALPLPQWIRQVVQYRAERGPGERAVQQGFEESRQFGVQLIGEIATESWPNSLRDPEAPQVLVFRELLGLRPERQAELWQTATDYVDAAAGPRFRGLSPHAPYTIPVDLVRRVCQLSAERRFPVAMHLAESIEELELLQSGSGPFYEFLQDVGAWDPAAIPRGIRPRDYLELLATSHRALAIHGNYFGAEEFEVLARHADRLSVVYCPRTHARFGHSRYPLTAMCQAGLRVALGTDSRASTPDLDLLEEMRLVAWLYPELELATILRMGTQAGAEALGLGHEWGTLEVGKRATLTAVELPDEDASDPHALVLQAAGRPYPVNG